MCVSVVYRSIKCWYPIPHTHKLCLHLPPLSNGSLPLSMYLQQNWTLAQGIDHYLKGNMFQKVSSTAGLCRFVARTSIDPDTNGGSARWAVFLSCNSEAVGQVGDAGSWSLLGSGSQRTNKLQLNLQGVSCPSTHILLLCATFKGVDDIAYLLGQANVSLKGIGKEPWSHF